MAKLCSKVLCSNRVLGRRPHAPQAAAAAANPQAHAPLSSPPPFIIGTDCSGSIQKLPSPPYMYKPTTPTKTHARRSALTFNAFSLSARAGARFLPTLSGPAQPRLRHHVGGVPPLSRGRHVRRQVRHQGGGGRRAIVGARDHRQGGGGGGGA